MSAPDLLLEIGVEELPASFLDRALEAMPTIAAELLGQARLVHGEILPLGTPRRLALVVRGLAPRQSDLAEEVVGPPKRVAYGEDGALTKAGQGFAKKQGVAPEELRVVTTDKGEYVAFTREEKGRPAAEVLPEVLAELAGRIPFRKSMRWGPGEIAFGRPIHWLICLHGEDVVPLSFAGIDAGNETRGHRFLASEEIEVPSVAAYVDTLRRVRVLVDPNERRTRMREALDAEAKSLGGVLVEDPFLIDECAGMVEEPFVVPGSFDPSFLDLPENVIISVMRDHQRYFAVKDGDGKLMPRYLNVVNTANEPEIIAHGNDRVLKARLDDARFFVDEDRKVGLEARVPRLDEVVFQKKLGSIGDKVRRIAELAASLAGDEAEAARRAALLSKVDLVTLMVGEFPELQGEMGAFYAAEQGVPPVVSRAIAEHYLPRGAGDDVPTAPVSAALAIADRVDTLVGCFGVGLKPSGSADPFALRRAALGVIRIALGGPMDVSLGSVVRRAHALYDPGVLRSADETAEALDAFFRGRLKALYSEDHPTDLVQACLGAWDGESVRDLDARVRAVAAFRQLPEYEPLAVAFKRAFNIAKDAPDGEADPSLYVEDAEKALAEVFEALRPSIESSVSDGAYDDALGALATSLKTPIDRFFDEVLVIHEDEKIRDNRLRLLGGITRAVTGIAHFHELST